MASQTPDFGLNFFGGDVPGSLTDDGGKFTNGDRLLIARVLKALEDHDHKGGGRLTDPTGPPAVAMDTLNGQLPGGLNVYYRVAYLDKFGLETAASLEVVQATPTPLLSPTAPTLAAAALGVGSTAPGLAAGSYTYALTAISGVLETPLGDTAQLDITTLLTTVVTFPDAVDDSQDSWGVWRMGEADSGWTKVGVGLVDDLDFTDDGSVPANPCACDPGQAPPTDNLTASTNAITVSVPDAELVNAIDGQVTKWRLYRTFASGSYANASLVAEVTSTVNEDGTGGLITEWTDDGATPLQTGSPLEISQCLTPSIAIAGGTGGGISAVLLSDGASIWRIVTDSDGALITRLSGGFIADLAVQTWLVSDPGGAFYQLTVGTDGALTTTVGSPSSPAIGDTVYAPDQGPLLPSPDPTIAYMLGVADDGSLTTVEV